jgi:hypothetical protein
MTLRVFPFGLSLSKPFDKLRAIGVKGSVPGSRRTAVA